MSLARDLSTMNPRGRWLRFFLGVVLAACMPVALAAVDTAVVRLWNWNVHDKKFQQKMYKLFNERHPHIKIDYSSISSTMYASALEAAFVAKVDLLEMGEGEALESFRVDPWEICTLKVRTAKR